MSGSGFYPYDGGVAGAPGEDLDAGSMTFGFAVVIEGRLKLLSFVTAANDAAAAVAGVEMNEVYFNGSALVPRIA